MSRHQAPSVVGTERLYISLPRNLLSQFERYCDRNRMKMSSRIAVLIQKDLTRQGENR